MSPRMQEILPRRANRQALYRGHPRLENCLHLRETVHWLWYLSQEMPLRCHLYHQLAHQSRNSSYPSILGQQFQAPQTSDAKTRTSAGTSWNKRYWQEHSYQDSEWKVETELGKI